MRVIVRLVPDSGADAHQSLLRFSSGFLRVHLHAYVQCRMLFKIKKIIIIITTHTHTHYNEFIIQRGSETARERER